MAGLVTLRRSWGRQKPPLGTGIDLSHPRAAGLAGAWAFQEGGGSPRDLIAGVAAVPTGGPTWTPGDRGPAYRFNGSSQYAALPDSAQIDLSTLTLTVRFRTTATMNAGEVLLQKEDSGFTGNRYPYAFQSFQGTGTMSFRTYDGTNSAAVTSPVLNDGTFHTLSATRIGGQTIALYADGRFVGSAADVSGATTGNGVPVYLGARGGGSPSLYLACDLDLILIHARVLTAGEIDWLAREPSAAFLPPASRRSVGVGSGGGGGPVAPKFRRAFSSRAGSRGVT